MCKNRIISFNFRIKNKLWNETWSYSSFIKKSPHKTDPCVTPYFTIKFKFIRKLNSDFMKFLIFLFKTQITQLLTNVSLKKNKKIFNCIDE